VKNFILFSNQLKKVTRKMIWDSHSHLIKIEETIELYKGWGESIRRGRKAEPYPIIPHNTHYPCLRMI